MITVMTALAAALWLEAALAHWREMLHAAHAADKRVWIATDLPPSMRLARAVAFTLYLIFWPLVLLIGAVVANAISKKDTK